MATDQIREMTEHQMIEFATRMRTERDALRAEVKQLRDDSYWLQFTWLDEYCKGEEQDAQIPDHMCEFVYQPDKAACDFHERWFGVAERNGLMEMFFEQDMERAESLGEVGH